MSREQQHLDSILAHTDGPSMVVALIIAQGQKGESRGWLDDNGAEPRRSIITDQCGNALTDVIVRRFRGWPGHQKSMTVSAGQRLASAMMAASVIL